MSELVRHSSAVSVAGIRIQSMAELIKFSEFASKSSMVPSAFKGRQEDVLLAIQMGSELGLSPMQSLQNIAVINGRPSLWGDAMLGVCRSSNVCKSVQETIEGEGDKMVAHCVAERTNGDRIESSFSVEDALKAKLWNKQGPWTQYPKRMLQMRARGFALRDAFPDVLRGLISAEEAADIPIRNSEERISDIKVDQNRVRSEEWTDKTVGRIESCSTTEEIAELQMSKSTEEGLAFLKKKGFKDLIEKIDGAIAIRLKGIEDAFIDSEVCDEGGEE